ncbi:MAG: alpha/beta hydrolase [Methylomonas sp.]|nr:alpha/beta hydrolase [Methylomonas sp.]
MTIRRTMIWLFIYLSLLLTVFLLQRKMLYFPVRFSEAQQARLADAAYLKAWPSENDPRGLIGKTEIKNARGTILVFHGNAGAAVHRGYFVEGLQNLGYRVVLAEYPGYGARLGAPSETRLIEDGIASAELAVREFGEPLFLCGESLGTGIVAGIVDSGKLRPKGVLLITPFDTLTKVAHHHYWFLLARWLLQDRYDNVSRLKNYRGTVAMLVAADDEIIPNERSFALYDQLQGRKKRWVFENAGHNSLPLDANQAWWHEVMLFLEL